MTLNLNSEQFKKLFKHQSLHWQHPSIKLCFVDYNNSTEVDNNGNIEFNHLIIPINLMFYRLY
jgi:hypothetical protein